MRCNDCWLAQRVPTRTFPRVPLIPPSLPSSLFPTPPPPPPQQQARDLADFLLPMLAFDPSERATAAKALQHPWLNGPSAAAAQRSSRDAHKSAAADSSRHSSRHGSEHKSGGSSRRGSMSERNSDSKRGTGSSRKASGSKRSSRPPSFSRSRSRTRTTSRGYNDKRAR